MSKQTDQRLIDYLHNALSDADRATLEQALRDDPALMARLQRLRRFQQQTQQAISAELNAQQPPASMTFEAISAELSTHRPDAPLRSRILSGLSAFAAIAVLLFAVIYSLPDPVEVQFEGSGATVTTTTIEALLPVVTATPSFTQTLTPGGSSIPPRSSIPTPEGRRTIPDTEPDTEPEPEPEIEATPEATLPNQFNLLCFDCANIQRGHWQFAEMHLRSQTDQPFAKVGRSPIAL